MLDGRAKAELQSAFASGPADINECSSADACGPNSNCINAPGNYTCACQSGYTLLDGKTAKDDGCTGMCSLLQAEV
jgi:hypothetical protein